MLEYIFIYEKSKIKRERGEKSKNKNQLFQILEFFNVIIIIMF